MLLIVLDTVRRDRLSTYGHPIETTPALDDFARYSTRFTRAVSPAQWTVPAHASLFTGLYPTSHQLTQADGRLSPYIPTLAETLRAGGYATAGFCNNPLVGVLDNGLTRGFSHFYNYAGAAPNRPQDLTRAALRRAVARWWGRLARRVSQQFAHNDWLFRLSLNPLLTPLWTRSVNYKGSTEHAVDDLIEVLRGHRAGGRSQPFFGFLNLMGAHMPLRPPRDVLARIAPEISRDKSAYRFMARFNADAARWASPTDPPLSAWEQRVISAFYEAEIAHQDAHVGRLLAYLKASGALKDTLVVIVADHGEGHGDHHFFGHSFVVYQELVHVPMMIAYPDGFPSGATVTRNVSTRRLFHTMLDLAGLTPPLDDTHPNAAVADLSLMRSTNGHPDSEGGLAYAEAIPPQTFLTVLRHRQPEMIDRLKLTQTRRGVYADDHKLAVVGDTVEGLFDLAADPVELRDLSAQQGERTAALNAHLAQFVMQAQALRVVDGPGGQVTDAMLADLRALGYID